MVQLGFQPLSSVLRNVSGRAAKRGLGIVKAWPAWSWAEAARRAAPNSQTQLQAVDPETAFRMSPHGPGSRLGRQLITSLGAVPGWGACLLPLVFTGDFQAASVAASAAALPDPPLDRGEPGPTQTAAARGRLLRVWGDLRGSAGGSKSVETGYAWAQRTQPATPK